jgi:hypothetical protein
MIMPVEIKELVIRAVVTEEGRKDTPEQGDAGKGVPSDVVVRAAVEEVLRILKASKER